ncbi:SDH family Clp fold serine proteinase [Faecalibaculum rodentium]|uniref:SDH family Clp fold serine proteinase n=2 Tax=Faecalibaculum rodentium TaxID=1702221 RepID=UPI0025A68DAD|nr:hypothetical protein [Faecalibaculum rodentium]
MSNTWNGIMLELGNYPSAFDAVRKKYIRQLSDLTGRNIIVYYSGWLQKPENVSGISDGDMEGFMNAVNDLDCSKGVDLILHTPGGSPTAAEAIVNYLKDKFHNDIRVIVPQLSMSAGTMIACAAREIVMGKQSGLGPIDPQYCGIPMYNIISEFNEAKEDLAKNPGNANYWAIKLQQYPAAFLKSCYDAISLSSTLAEEWLKDNMLKETPETVDKIVSFLNSHDDNYDHSRHFNYKTCQEIGLHITLLEDNQKFQDAVLALHHSLIITLQSTNAVKIIENQNGNAYII